MNNWFLNKKATALIATFALVFAQLGTLPVANAANILPQAGDETSGPVYDLVLLVVDNTLESSGNFVGLSGASSLGDRISRYAEDVRANNELTDVKIIFFDKSKDTVLSLTNALENIYLNGDDSAGHRSALKGVVLIGDIPLPVVNKKGNRYISLFPYTDFVEKAYSYNEKTQSFERNDEVTYPKPELWHGVMRAPTNDNAGRDKLAQFFDKNHLYYTGDPAYSEFGRKLFFGDLKHEEESVSSDMYKQYLKYLEAMEDVAYFRYNKFWAKELSGQVAEALQFNGENEFNKPVDDNDPSTPDSPGFLAALQDGSAFDYLPDVYSKSMIDSILAPYYKLVTKYLAKVNDFSEGTGRYKTQDVDSVAELINIKDEFTKFYLKSVNDALEIKINEVVEKIQEPISITDTSEISGRIGAKDFELTYSDTADQDPNAVPLIPVTIKSFIYRFNYYNEALGKIFINGIEGDLLESAKQCSVFLGSTKSSYFDVNQDYNPKAAAGEYSILVRAMRSDNVKTAAPTYTTGVNTRLLSTSSLGGEQSELAKATDGAYAGNVNADGVNESGAIVESKAKYGVSAFLVNPLVAEYKNPWTDFLEPGDVITAVNGKNLSYAYTFDQAIDGAYKAVEKVIDAVNDNKVAENLKNFPYKIVAYDEPPQIPGPLGGSIEDPDPNFKRVETYANAGEIVNAARLKNTEVGSVLGIMKVEIYHGGQKSTKQISFTVNVEDGIKHPSAEDAVGGEGGAGYPEVVVLFNTSLPNNFDFDSGSNGAIFALYQGRNDGFASGAYDSSAGCNSLSTNRNSDRCLAKVATMPVLDPAGSTGLVKMEVPGVGVKLKFPENVKKNEQGVNSGREIDHQTHVDQFQVPSNYKFEDIDEVYYDACFNGLPSVGGLGGDSNLFVFPLDTSTDEEVRPIVGGVEVPDVNKHEIHEDFYGRLLDSFGKFVKELGDDRDLVPGDSEEPVSDYKATESLWLNMANLDASGVVLHNGDGDDVTLKDFSDRYGLFDGINNNPDENDIADFEWRDTNNDGVFETKFVDFSEADAKYGLPSGNLAMIARKMFSQTSSYTVPGDALADDDFNEDITLNVAANEFKKISSVILHDEPTMDTITAQLNSQGTKSLPIDNPRYVAFQAEPNSMPKYPEPAPVNPGINVEAIVEDLDLTSYYTPGVTVKVFYPNLFDSEITNLAQLNAMVNSKADQLASTSGSYRIMGEGATAEDYDDQDGRERIKQKILNELLEVTNNLVDDPEDGFELKAANTKKMYDALQWKNFNIDEKHEYVLSTYLDAEKEAYVADSEEGYEGAYLVLNGDEESFDLNFNKDLPPEVRTPFDPVVQAQEAAEAQELAESNPQQEEDDGFEFVWLDQFFKETEEFLSAFTTVPKFEEMCVNIEDEENVFGGEQVRADNNGQLGRASQGLENSDAGNKLELYTYTYLEVDGRSELEALIQEQAELFREGQANGDQGADGANGTEEGASGTGDNALGTDDGDGAASGDEPAAGDGGDVSSSEEISSDGDNGSVSGQEENAKDIVDILSGKKEVTANVNSGQSFDEEIKGILNEESGVGQEVQAGESEEEETKAGENTNTEEGDASASLSDESLENTDTNTGDSGESLANTERDTSVSHWYDYYMQSKYYEKFLDEPVSYEKASSSLVVEGISDRMLAFIPDEQNPFVDEAENPESKYLVTATSSMTADGESLMEVQAHIFNLEGKHETEKKLKVKFEIEDISTGQEPSEIAIFENGDTATSKDGVATVYLRSGVHTGEFVLKASVVNAAGVADPNYQIPLKRIGLSASDPRGVEITAESSVLLANGLSKTLVVATLKDKNGNTVNDALSNVTIFVSGAGYIDPKIDQNLNAVGIQLAVFDGSAIFTLQSKNQPGVINLIALITDSELEEEMTEAGENFDDLNFDGYIGARKEFKVAREMKLNFKVVDSDFAESPGVVADGESLARIGVELMADGAVAQGFNGKVNFELLTRELGAVNVKPGVSMENGVLNPANANFKASKTAGTVQISIEIPGFVSETLRFKSEAGPAVKIVVTSSKSEIYTLGQDEVELTARIVDKNGNTVEKADRLRISFAASEATKDFVTFSEAQPETVKGVAKTKLKGARISGMANIIASRAGLDSGLISLKVKKHLDAEAVKNLNPKALYISLLGGAFGNIKNPENSAQNFLYTGQVEAVSAITASVEGKKRLLSIDPYGKLDVLGDTITSEIKQSTDSFPYQKVILSDSIANKQLAEVFVVPKPDSKVVLLEKDVNFEQGAAGILVKDMTEEGAGLKVEKQDDGVYLVTENEKGKQTKGVIDNFGRVKILDPSITLRMADDKDDVLINNFGFIIEEKNTPVAAMMIKENFSGVTLIEFGNARQNFAAGVYFKMMNDDAKYATGQALTRASTAEASGMYLLDLENELDAPQKPGFPQSSLEDAGNKLGLGFDGDNKHMLLFSAGSSLGQANNLYASDVGIVFGDPMVKVKKSADLISEGTHLTKDIGQNIYSGQEDVQEVVQMDYNGDERKDLLLVYQSGMVRLLENEESNSHFRDRGYILDIDGGVISMAAIDLDDDGFDDLIAGTKEACKADEECVSVFRNRGGSLERESLNLAIEGKIEEMKSEDMNEDSCSDLVVSDSAGNIRIFNNKKEDGNCTGLVTNYVYSKNFGVELDPASDLSGDLYLNYSGIRLPVDDPNVTGDDNVVMTMTLESGEPEASQAEFAAAGTAIQTGVLENSNFASADVPRQTFSKEFGFLPIGVDVRFAGSTKKAVDANAGSVAVGDKIDYTITLQNRGAAVGSLMISDITSPSMTLDMGSLRCAEAGCGEVSFLETGMSNRAYVIRNINVPANSTRTIVYTATVDQVTKVHFDLGNDFTTYPDNRGDGYADILVKPTINPDNSLRYIYSVKEPATNKIAYKYYKKSPAPVDIDSLLAEEFKKAGLPDMMALLGFDPDNVPQDVKDAAASLANTQTQDKDYNGCADSWSNILTTYKTGADAVATAVENGISALRCSGGGCLPNPYNQALLVPRWAVPGIAVFAAGVPNPIGIAAFYPSSAPSTFRLYVSPTTTLGVGFAVCSGPSIGHTSPCYAFAVPGGVPGLCQGIKEGLDNAIASVPDSIVNPDLGMSTVVSDGGESVDSKTFTAGEELLPDLIRDKNGEGPLSVGASVNIRIPGFPSVITNWIDKEIDEIYNKLMDPMKFYLILPDFTGFFKMAEEDRTATEKTDFLGLHDFLSTINRIPIIQIEGKPIVMKIPALSKNQIEKYQMQGRLWLKHMKSELEKYSTWNCDESPDKRNICDKILVDIQDLISSVQKLMDLLDRIANLPRDILNWRDAEAKYANQIICYLDAVMQFTGGYINRQQKIIESWIKAAQDAIRTFKDWKVLLDAIIDYQQSCDQCKNDRFSDLGLLLNVFLALPDLPVIPMPKLPDVVFDFSQIKTGVKFTWPDLQFKPQPILLPDLPTIVLPDVIPNLSFKIPGFDVPDIPDLILPDLPDLPPLPLPDLPDIPRPPRIPTIPPLMAQLVANLKPIFKILCLLKNGVIPVPEGGLATEIETLTQPSVQVVLPIIKKLAVQWPEIQYDYVKEIRVTGKLNFDVKTDFIYDVADKGASYWNQGVEGIVREINKYTQAPYGEILSAAIQAAVDEAAKKLEKEAGEIKRDLEEEDTEGNTGDAEASLPEEYLLTAKVNYLDANDPLMNRTIAEVEAGALIEALPDNAGMNNLSELRDGLIAYSKDLENGKAAIESMDSYSTFDHVLVNNESIRKVAEITKVNDSVGANEVSTLHSSPRTLAFNVLSPQTEAALQEEVEESKRLLAANIGDPEAAPAGDASQGGTGKPAKGFYIIGEDGVNENVINYTSELNGNTNVVFMDYDSDEDTDIVYTMGGEVYLKENYKVDEEMPRGAVIVGLNKNEVSDFINAVGPAVEGAKSEYATSGKADVSWKKSGNNIVGYEIIVTKSLLVGDESDRRSYLALTEKSDTEKSKALIEALDSEYEKIFELTSPDEPSISLEIPNGNYFAEIYALDAAGNRSNPSMPVLLAPQICADKEPPFPSIGKSEYEISIFKPLIIDASNSFDPDGEVAQYYLETLPYDGGGKKVTEIPQVIWSDSNVIFDRDGDGIPWNDRTNSIFKVGPFVNEGDIGTHEFVLHVVDEAGNNAKQKIIAKVFAPEISLNPTFSRSLQASGETSPTVDNMPFSLMRSRFVYRVIEEKLSLIPTVQKILTEMAGSDSQYHTDQNGSYLINDFNSEDIILVQTASGEIAAEINGETGNIGNVRDGYKVLVEAAKDGKPMAIVIEDPFGRELGRVYIISNPNIDVKIHDQLGFTEQNTANLQGTNIDDLNAADKYVFKKLGADDSGHPGGAVLIDTEASKQLAVVDASGNIVTLASKIKLRVKKNKFKVDPLIIEIVVGQRVVAEVYVAAMSGVDRVKIVGPNDVPFLNPNELPAADIKGNFGSVSSADAAVKSLFDKGILEGEKTDLGFEYKPEEMINRAEFVKVVLKMLCIIPGPDSYKQYAAGTVYNDIEFSPELVWYYPYVKEATKLGLVEGYKGDPDPDTGLFPFRADATVSRAEAVKIILQALELKGVIDLSTVKEGNPWYGDYLSVAQDLTPYLKTDVVLKNNFLITPQEAQAPEKALSFEELTDMALRVLDIYNCFELDNDNDGMSDYCEEKFNISDPSGDEDKDELVNKLECLNNLNPRDEDTDKGGVLDGIEFNRGTNALNPADDVAGVSIQKQEDAVVKGVYLVPAECNTCPCSSTFINGADVLAGDTFFSVISTKEENYFFSKSEEVTIENTK